MNFRFGCEQSLNVRQIQLMLLVAGQQINGTLTFLQRIFFVVLLQWCVAFRVDLVQNASFEYQQVAAIRPKCMFQSFCIVFGSTLTRNFRFLISTLIACRTCLPQKIKQKIINIYSSFTISIKFNRKSSFENKEERIN